MNVRLLLERESAPITPVFRPIVPVLRGQDHPNDRDATDTCIGVRDAPQGSIVGVGELRPQRDENQGTCERSNLHWPGKGTGIRGPICDETPLSESEFLHFFRNT